MDYSTLVKTTDFSKLSDKKVFSKTEDYQDALEGNKTDIFKKKVTAPLGSRYFYQTDIMCDKKNRLNLFINAKPSGEKSIFDSAIFNINRISDNLNDSTKFACKKRTKQTISIGGNKKKQKRYTEPFIIQPDINEMDIGQKFFIMSISVFGLFLFYRGINRSF